MKVVPGAIFQDASKPRYSPKRQFLAVVSFEFLVCTSHQVGLLLTRPNELVNVLQVCRSAFNSLRARPDRLSE